MGGSGSRNDITKTTGFGWTKQPNSVRSGASFLSTAIIDAACYPLALLKLALLRTKCFDLNI